MKLSLGLKINKADRITQIGQSELPDLNVYLVDEHGNKYVYSGGSV